VEKTILKSKAIDLGVPPEKAENFDLAREVLDVLQEKGKIQIDKDGKVRFLNNPK
jgi:hypothetical protein